MTDPMPAPHARLVEIANGLSDHAAHICAQDYFLQVLKGKPILMAPRNKAQEKVFEELLDAGLVHGDVERGVYGYRSTYDGRDVGVLCRHAMSLPKPEPEKERPDAD